MLTTNANDSRALDRPLDSADYRNAAVTLWGDAGAWAHDCYTALLPLFTALPGELPIAIGITAYGKCLGLTRYDDAALDGPRITIASNLFAQGRNCVYDVMAHEMTHVELHRTGRNPAHAGRDWYSECRRLAPVVLGHDLDIRHGRDRRSIRIPNPDYHPETDPRTTLVRKERVSSTHARVAGFPQAFRPDGYDWGAQIACPSY